MCAMLTRFYYVQTCGRSEEAELERLTCAPEPIQNAAEHGQIFAMRSKLKRCPRPNWSECSKLWHQVSGVLVPR